ncbi:DUF1806 family protein [Aliicoccus persicus]|uniref:DUF1806 family protein n=1 Tax=Aliicoccus persicus TaxID=930138 RepID=A0A662Z3V4_9STAP|nr:DUF1806 family protein [Aliicoccus persicus]SEW07107.1 Protein of unknown function [Aliicoccus persicus]
MEPINQDTVQSLLDAFVDKRVYIHVEITSGMYASHVDQEVFNAGTFVRNVQVNIVEAIIKKAENDQYRVGIKLDNGGWIYVIGLTHFIVNEEAEFIMHGFNYQGKLASALELSHQPFRK